MVMNRIYLLTLSVLVACFFTQAPAQDALYLGDNYYRKNMVKAFKAIKDHKLDKAEKYRDDILKKASKDKDLYPQIPVQKQLYPVWDLSTSMIMNCRDGRGKSVTCPPYNPWTAYDLIKEISQRAIYVQNANLFLSHKDIGLTIAEIKSSIEVNLIDSVRKLRTEAAYDKLLALLFSYDDVSTLYKEREQAAYDELKNTYLLSECKRYLDKYNDMNHAHRTSMEWRRDSLAFDELAYTAAACEKYLTDYPMSHFNPQVEERLHKCAFDELEASVAACKRYLELYPSSTYCAEVKTLQEQYAYRDAQQSNSVGAYKDFLKEYPNSSFASDAKGLMRKVLISKYLDSNVSLDELYRVCDNLFDVKMIDGSQIETLYTNLLFMPTSALVMGYDGLVGPVNISTSSEYGENGEEKFYFSNQGLMKEHSNSRTGAYEEYRYSFDYEHGFRLLSKTDALGNTVKYTMEMNPDGSLKEIKGSDGSRVVYSNDYYQQLTYYKGASFIKKDCYDSKYRLIESSRSGNIVIEYKYNQEGDVISISKRRGNAILEETTFEYEYADAAGASKQWIRMWQYNNGSYVLSKSREYYKTIDRVQSNSHRTYKIDWYSVKL